MKYTIKDLRKDFPNDDVCLNYIFAKQYEKKCCTGQLYRVRGRKSYACSMCGKQVHPLKGTIFEKSSTPLTLWFHAIFLFASSKNGVSAKELQRQLGVTYKTAWRIGHQIRQLMEQGTDPLSGVVEVDETYYGKGGKNADKFKKKNVVFGMVERKGNVKAKIIKARTREAIIPELRNNIARGSHIMTDEAHVYDRLGSVKLSRSKVKHGKKHWVYKNAHTNTIEGFWGQFKRSVRGTYHFISSKHLQTYLDEFAFRYNLRASSVPIFEILLGRV